MNSLLELNEFFVEGGNRENNHVLLHITEPTKPEEWERGYFFALAHIYDGTIGQIENTQSMIDDLEKDFFQSNSTSPLEHALEKANRRGHHIINNPRSTIHFAVGGIRDGAISLSYHGHPMVNLFYKSGDSYQRLDVLAKETSTEGQLFSAVLEGKMGIGDFFCVCTPNTEETFPADRIQKIIISRSTKDAAEHVRKVLSDLRDGASYGGIFFHNIPFSEAPKTGKFPTYMERGSAASLQKMNSGAEETVSTMSGGPIKGIGNFLADKIKNRTQKNTEEPEEENNYRPRKQAREDTLLNLFLITFGKFMVVNTTALFKFLKKAFLLIWKLTVGLILFITNRDQRRAEVANEIKRWWQNKKMYFSSLSLLSKTLFLLSLTLGLIFFSSIFYIKTKEKKEIARREYDNVVLAITDKRDAAEASLIYGDDEKAFAFLREAEKLIADLPRDNKEQKEKVDILTSELESSLIKLRKTNIVTAEVIADLSSFPYQLSRLAMINDSLLAYGVEGETAALVSLNTGEQQTINKNPALSPKSSTTPKENDKIVFSTGSGIADFTVAQNTIVAREIHFPAEETEVADIFIYNRRLYSLAPDKNQIYKHSETQTGYDKGVPWIKSESDIKDAVSLAVDGDIFVLEKNGNIKKFSGGEQSDFNIKGLDPTLTNPTDIWTYADLDLIFVLEPQNKRLVILKKSGELVGQYTVADWLAPTDFAVIPESKTIYALDERKIYKFSY